MFFFIFIAFLFSTLEKYISLNPSRFSFLLFIPYDCLIVELMICFKFTKDPSNFLTPNFFWENACLNPRVHIIFFHNNIPKEPSKLSLFCILYLRAFCFFHFKWSLAFLCRWCTILYKSRVCKFKRKYLENHINLGFLGPTSSSSTQFLSKNNFIVICVMWEVSRWRACGML